MQSQKCDLWCVCGLMLLWWVIGFSTAASSNDNQNPILYSVEEELEPGTVIGDVVKDSGLKTRYPGDILSRFQFAILRGHYKEYFSVDLNNGLLQVNATLDRDTMCPRLPQCEINLDIAVIKPVEYFQIIKASVLILDENDNDPAFTQDIFWIRISESASPGVGFVLPEADDPDSGEYGVQGYYLESAYTAFELEVSPNQDGSNDLKLLLKEKLDRELQSQYEVKVVARDGGQPPRTGSLSVVINIVDANDNPPVFTSALYNVTIREDAAVMSPVVRVRALDADDGLNGEVFYQFSDQTNANSLQVFGINQESGEIFVRHPLDYESETTYHLVVTAMDKGPNSIPTFAKVIIHVTDVNDFSPRVTVNSLTSTGDVSVRENADPEAFVAYVSVEDLDQGSSGVVSCHIPDNKSMPFRLVEMYEQEYQVLTTAVFDHEIQSEHVLSIECQDQGFPPLTTTERITVHILDENDNTPVFSKSEYRTSVHENNRVGDKIIQVTATDADDGENAEIMYSIHSSMEHLVAMDPQTGSLAAKVQFDHETIQRLDIQVYAVDGGNPPLKGVALVHVEILDVNDEAPVFAKSAYRFGTFENQQAGTEIGRVSATDNDSPPFNQFMYTFADSTDPKIRTKFEIESRSGRILTKRLLDREDRTSYNVTVVAMDLIDRSLYSSVPVTILVGDQNDNAPHILFPNEVNNTVTISSSLPPGSVFTRVLATDSDVGNNAMLTYSIAEGNGDSVFDIDPTNGAISTSKYFQEGQYLKSRYNLLLMVTDHGIRDKFATINLFVQINRTASEVNRIGASSSTSSIFHMGQFGSHEKIIIGLAGSTLLLVICLITVIICLKRKQRMQRRGYKYSATLARETTTFIRGSNLNLEKWDRDALPEDKNAAYLQVKGQSQENALETGLTSLHDLSASSSGISTASDCTQEVSKLYGIL